MPGTIAIVGRPNVGKSALFNRIAGRRIAIVHDMPGVTRDRVSVEAEWRGRVFSLVDTGGIGLVPGEKSPDVITNATTDQVDLAIEAADLILFVVDIREGVVPLDQEVAERLRAASRPVVLVVNKADNSRLEPAAAEFSSLGFERILPVSAIHGRGLDDLMEVSMRRLVEILGTRSEDGESAAAQPPNDARGEGEPLKISIVGRPNVGKSSIINSLTRSDRVIVSEIPGTTRDAVDVPFEIETDGVRERFLLIDTAGVRKKRRVDDSVEFFSVVRTEDAIERSDLVVLVLDADQGITVQDKKISDKITGAGKSCIVVVNKWDLVSEEVKQARLDEIRRRSGKGRQKRGARYDRTTLSEFAEWVQEQLFFLSYAPVIFTSAKSGFHLDRLLESIRYVQAQLEQQIPTALLNRTLQDAVTRRQPPSDQGHQLKLFYATQVKQRPPTFLLFVNRKDLWTRQYEKYVSEQMRKAFGYEGCPIHLVPKPRPKKVESIRRRAPNRNTSSKPERRQHRKAPSKSGGQQSRKAAPKPRRQQNRKPGKSPRGRRT